MKIWGVIVVVVVGVLVLEVPHGSADSGQGIYPCLGGCYNKCGLLGGLDPSKGLTCFMKCIVTCFGDASPLSQNYCQLGCSLAACNIYNSAGGTSEGCLENCSNNICNLNT